MIRIRPLENETHDEFMNRGMGDDLAQELYPNRAARMQVLAHIYRGTNVIEFEDGKYGFRGPRGFVYLNRLLITTRGGPGDHLASEPTVFIIPVGRPGKERGEQGGKEYWDFALQMPMDKVPFLQEALVEQLTAFLRKTGDE
jgi:hypothetical protein